MNAKNLEMEIFSSRLKEDWAEIAIEEKERIFNVLKLYNLQNGKISKNKVGGANEIYLIDAEPGEFILRRSKIAAPGAQNNSKRREHLLFQSEVLEFLKKEKFNLVPKIYKNVKGELVTENNGEYFMLFSFIKGERKGNWNDLKNINPMMMKNFFRALGKFAKVLKEFNPKYLASENTLLDYAFMADNWLVEVLNRVPNKIYQQINKRMPEFKKFAKTTLEELNRINYGSLPKQVVHFDYHLGNVLFNHNKISGIVDLDWARLDCRFADLASGIALSCPYKGSYKGKYSSHLIQLALDSYRETFGKSEYSKKEEKEILKGALRSYVFFQFLYTLEHYANKKVVSLDDLNFAVNTVLANNFNRLFQGVK